MKNLKMLKLAAAIATVTSLGLGSAAYAGDTTMKTDSSANTSESATTDSRWDAEANQDDAYGSETDSSVTSSETANPESPYETDASKDDAYGSEKTSPDLYGSEADVTEGDATDDSYQGSPSVTSTTEMGADTETELHITHKPIGGFKADDLIGQNVMNRSSNKDVGEVTDMVIDKDGQVIAVIVSTGGALGIGEKSVAIGWDQLERSVDDDEVTLFVEMDEQALESAPEYASN